MLNTIEIAEASTQPTAAAPAMPKSSDVSDFKTMLEGANPATESLRSFVSNAQDQLARDQTEIDKKLRHFDSQNSISSLVDAMHTSSLKSVSIQLTSKIGTKVSESFEQLVKQQ